MNSTQFQVCVRVYKGNRETSRMVIEKCVHRAKIFLFNNKSKYSCSFLFWTVHFHFSFFKFFLGCLVLAGGNQSRACITGYTSSKFASSSHAFFFFVIHNDVSYFCFGLFDDRKRDEDGCNRLQKNKRAGKSSIFEFPKGVSTLKRLEMWRIAVHDTSNISKIKFINSKRRRKEE
jgi:hypothetical protein